jgi:hypothetical protein
LLVRAGTLKGDARHRRSRELIGYRPGGDVPLGARHQAGVDERQGLAEELGADRARLDQLIDRGS